MRQPPHVLVPLRKALLVAALATLLIATLVVGATGGHDRLGATADTAATTAKATAVRYRLVQANMWTGSSVAKFQADVKHLMRTHADFITYEEVAHRHNEVLGQGTYKVARGSGLYKGETAVAWDSSRWKLVDHGTRMLSNQAGTQAGRTTEWGVRYANWVKLRNKKDGKKISVVAAHFAPDTAQTRNLTAPSARRLSVLVANLSRFSPVLVGGDLNVGYHDSRYPRGIFSRHRLMSTYDVLQKREVTSGTNVTIDYVLARGVAKFSIGHQFVLGLNSDHNAVGADFSPVPAMSEKAAKVRFGNGVVLNEPHTNAADSHTLVRMAVKAIRSAPKGATIHLATVHLNSSAIVKALTAAHRRRVHVQVLTADPTRSAAEARLGTLLGAKAKGKNWAVNRPGQLSKLPATTLLINNTGATHALRITSETGLAPVASRGANRSVTSTRAAAYRAYFRLFAAAAGL